VASPQKGRSTDTLPSYLDKFQNRAAGKGLFAEILKRICKQAGLPERPNHALRRSFIRSCYLAGMPEIAIQRLSRHTSVEGLREYADVSDEYMAAGLVPLAGFGFLGGVFLVWVFGLGCFGFDFCGFWLSFICAQ